ncbi:MAG: hypothetical protein U0354_15265 [Candidatus Sericytochromatia bacterium]
MNKSVIINLESKPYKLFECILDPSTLIVTTDEFIGNNFIKTFEQKKLNSNDLNDFYNYVNEISNKLNPEGFIKANDFYMQEYIEVINKKSNKTSEIVNFIEDEIGFLLKAEGPYSGIDLKTTRYIKAFNKTIYFSLQTDKTYKNLDSKVREGFKFFIENQFKIVEEMKLWFWDNWLFSEFYNDAVDYSLKQERYVEMMFDKGFDEYIKTNPSWINMSDVYEELKQEADKYFRLDKEIKSVQSNEDKIKIVDEIISIGHMEIDNYNTQENSTIRFYYDYFLDDHGFEIKFVNRNKFDI